MGVGVVVDVVDLVVVLDENERVVEVVVVAVLEVIDGFEVVVDDGVADEVEVLALPVLILPALLVVLAVELAVGLEVALA